MPALDARGIELAWTESGQGPPVVLIHDSAESREVWDPVAEALSRTARAITYDRRGWGASSAPDQYRRTTIEEQSEDAAVLIETLDSGPAVLCGAGMGSVIGLDLLLRRDELVSSAVLIEPLLLQLLPSGTEALSADRRRLEIAAGTGESVIDLYLSGGLPALGPSVARVPDQITAGARERPESIIAELGMATGWRMPLPSLATAGRPSAIVTSAGTPPLLRDVAAALDARLEGSSAHELDSGELAPHAGAPAEVASLALEISS